jgi:hypothetical protein
LIAGTLDALGAIIVYQADPAQMFRYIASGAFGGEKAFAGGSIMVVWGVLFHYVIAFGWTVFFFSIYSSVPVLRKNRYITGTIYGVFIWVIMNRVVVPLSAITPRPFNFQSAVIGASILIVAVGLPIAMLAHRYYVRKRSMDDFLR